MESFLDRKHVARMLILHTIGGFYVGVETKCLKNIEPLIRPEAELVVAAFQKKAVDIECFINCGYKDGPYLFNNFMGSIPNHPFWRYAMNNVRKHLDAPGWMSKSMAMSHSTGPTFLTKMFRSGWQNASNVQIVDRKLVDPCRSGLICKPKEAYVQNDNPIEERVKIVLIAVAVIVLSGTCCAGFLLVKRINNDQREVDASYYKRNPLEVLTD